MTTRERFVATAPLQRRFNWRRPASRMLMAAALAIGLTGCGGGDDEGGVIGTGIQLRGTVPTQRAFARSQIDIRSASGERSTASIAANGRFASEDITGEGPYLLRVDLGNDDAWYGIAFVLDAQSVSQNVHAYSDLAIRNWFATRGRDVAMAFDSDGPLTDLPTAEQIATIDARIRALIDGSLDAYALSDVDLGTASFDADDTGIDRFLDRNPVLINNGTITIVIADPVDATQTQVTDGLALSTDLTVPDNTVPSAPSVLRVLPSALDEIVLAWQGAADDIGIAHYEVLRDGILIATTAYPVLIDSPLQPNVTYAYSIISIDGSGNRSQPSAIGMSQTLPAPDVTAPPAPQDLQLTAGRNSVRSSWQQSMIGDVAAFRFERGTTRTNLQPIARVTSTFAIDAALNSGTEYCYRIVAVDASANDSPATPVTCVTTLGGSVDTAPVIEPVTPGSGGSTLAQVDVTTLACTEEVQDLIIDSAVTLNGSCLRVPSTLSVRENGRLTIAAGTVLKFASTAGLTIANGGSLTAVGTAAEPVVLSGLEATPGFWRGVTFTFSNSVNNRLENVVIEYAGTTDSAALESDTTSTLPVRLSADNLLLRHSAGAGFLFDPNMLLDRFTRIGSSNNAIAGILSPMSAAALTSDSSFIGNAIDVIQLSNQRVDQATAWNLLDVPMLVPRLTLDASLTLPAGAELRFTDGARLGIASSGSLNAIGTAAAPILMTGNESVPGYWEGLDFVFSASTNNRLEHVTVEYAGAGAVDDGAAITTDTTSTLPTRLQLASVTLRSNAGAGFRLDANTTLGGFDNVVVTGNGTVGTLAPSALAGFGSGNAFTGNAVDELELVQESIDRPLTIPSLGVPYRFAGLTVTDALTIDAGVTMRARTGAFIRVGSDGSISAVGNTSAPIVIEGGVAQPGYWNGIVLTFSNSPSNRLEFVTLSDGGGGSPTGTGGNIRMACTSTLPVQISIANSRIENSASWGIDRDNATNCVANLGSGVVFSGNALGELSPVPQ